MLMKQNKIRDIHLEITSGGIKWCLALINSVTLASITIITPFNFLVLSKKNQDYKC